MPQQSGDSQSSGGDDNRTPGAGTGPLGAPARTDTPIMLQPGEQTQRETDDGSARTLSVRGPQLADRGARPTETLDINTRQPETDQSTAREHQPQQVFPRWMNDLLTGRGRQDTQ